MKKYKITYYYGGAPSTYYNVIIDNVTDEKGAFSKFNVIFTYESMLPEMLYRNISNIEEVKPITNIN